MIDKKKKTTTEYGQGSLESGLLRYGTWKAAGNLTSRAVLVAFQGLVEQVEVVLANGRGAGGRDRDGDWSAAARSILVFGLHTILESYKHASCEKETTTQNNTTKKSGFP